MTCSLTGVASVTNILFASVFKGTVPFSGEFSYVPLGHWQFTHLCKKCKETHFVLVLFLIGVIEKIYFLAKNKCLITFSILKTEWCGFQYWNQLFKFRRDRLLNFFLLLIINCARLLLKNIKVFRAKIYGENTKFHVPCQKSDARDFI